MASDTQTDDRFGIGTSIQAWVSIYLKGLAMGAADSVPGVSGGTIAFIVGIYERLITAIAELDPRVAFELREIHRSSGRRRFLRSLVGMDVPFLLVLGSGVATALVLVTRFFGTALESAPAVTNAFFFGLIAASVIAFWDQFTLDSPLRIAAAVSGFVLAFLVSGLPTDSGVGPGLPLVFVAATIAISAMILPGVSGAFFLYLFGQYEYLSSELEAFVDGSLSLVIGDASLSTVVEPATVVFVFGLGALIGLLAFARVIRWALSNYRMATLAFLVSLMLGALRLPIEAVYDETTSWDPITAGGLLLAALVGGVAVLLLERYTGSMEY